MAEKLGTEALISRNACVICETPAVTPLVTIEGAPVFQGCVDADVEPRLADMDWRYCARCGSAQIVSMPSLDLVYHGGHATGLGDVWRRHHQAFAGFIKHHLRGERILEIGGGVGQLAAAARVEGITIPWKILEPNPVSTTTAPDDVEYVIGFVEPGFVDPSGSDVFVMSHVVEHFYFPAEVVRALSAALSEDDALFVAWPILEDWCDRLVPGALNFEHNYFTTLGTLIELFAAVGLELEHRDTFEPLNTAFLCFRKSGSKGSGGWPAAPDARAHPVALYYEGLRTLALAVDEQIARFEGPAFMTPASVYSQTLLTLGLDVTRFAGLLDNAPTKQGKALYGLDLPIRDPVEALANYDNPIVVLNAGAHNDEIRKQYGRLNPSSQFVDVRDVVGVIGGS